MRRYGDFSIFQDDGRRNLGFINLHNFNCRKAEEVDTALSCQISWRSIKLLRRYADFYIFQYGGFPPSWICDAHVWTTHEGHLVVFITVQNLVGIDAVVSITRMFLISRVWLENAYSRPQNRNFGGRQRNPCTDCKSAQ